MKRIGTLLAALLLLFQLGGCAREEGTAVTVQSVASITGMGSIGLVDRFAGVVSARSEVKIQKEDQRTVSEVYVQPGQTVYYGQRLFAYDIEESQLKLEKAELEQQKIRDSIASLEKQKAELEEQLSKTKKDADKLNYTLEIQTCETNIREANYNLALQEKEVERLQSAVVGYVITSPISGRIQSVNSEGGTDSQGNPLPFITIMEKGAYRVKGQVDEMNAATMVVGTRVLIRSRMDSSRIWNGTLALIDWENPVTGNQNRFYDGTGDEMTSSSKYPFYIELDSDEGLLLGQHVYIEPDWGQEDVRNSLALPAYYLFDMNGSEASVWARGGDGRLEKRTVALGQHDEMLDTWIITSGLDLRDWIAFPAENCKEGAETSEFDENAFETDPGMPPQDGDFPGEEFEGETGEFMPEEYDGDASGEDEQIPDEPSDDGTGETPEADETGENPETDGTDGTDGTGETEEVPQA